MFKTLCVTAVYGCLHFLHGGGQIFVDQVDGEGQTATHLRSVRCKPPDVALVVGSYSRAVGRSCIDRWSYWGCLDGRGRHKGHQEQGCQEGVLHDASKVD